MPIKNIIFDLGGVILDIDYQRTIKAFEHLGLADFEQHYNQAQQSGVFDAFEIGKASSQDFIAELQRHLPAAVTENEIITAWNAMLLDFLPGRIAFLEEIRQRYKIYLYSNINAIHQAFVYDLLAEDYGVAPFNALFCKTYYSHEFGYRKPHAAGFLKILEENQLLASETLFVDDSIQHVEGAAALGIQTAFVKGKSIMELGL
jgi:putative hydrolase of the HAD superfamily